MRKPERKKRHQEKFKDLDDCVSKLRTEKHKSKEQYLRDKDSEKYLEAIKASDDKYQPQIKIMNHVLSQLH